MPRCHIVHQVDLSCPDPAAPAADPRVAELETENTRLRHELQHRVRNMLAVVRSIAQRTAQTAGTVENYAMHLDGRMAAFARAQALLLRDPTGGVGLDTLLAEEFLAHLAHEGERVSLSGPAVRVRGKAAELLTLALYELMVNAVEHGALSAPGGTIAVTWCAEPGPAGAGEAGRVLRLEWRETGIASPDAPRRRGFGTEVIERTLAYELSATGSLDFNRDGVRCTLVLPLTDQVALAPGPG